MLDSLWSGIIPPRKGKLAPHPPAKEAPRRLEAMELCVSQPGDILPSEVAGESGAFAGDDAVESGLEEKQGMAEDMVTKEAFKLDNPSGEDTEGAVRYEAYAACG